MGLHGRPGKVVAELDAKLEAYPNARGATLHRRLFVRKRPKGTQATADGVRWHDLDDLYAR